MSLDVPAMERLFKDDKELEIKIKQGVMMNFIDKYLRKLLKDDFIRKQIEDIASGVKNEVHKIAEEEIGKVRKNSWGQTAGIDLNEKCRSAIMLKVRDDIDSVMSKNIEEYVKAINIEDRIKQSVDRKIKYTVDDEVDRKVNAILKEAMKNA
jgi:hypothetical protein